MKLIVGITQEQFSSHSLIETQSTDHIRRPDTKIELLNAAPPQLSTYNYKHI